jgi:flavorubredoxin
MAKDRVQSRLCVICGKTFPTREVMAGTLVREPVAQTILHDHPGWSSENYICWTDLARYRAKYVHSLLESEKGELTFLEHFESDECGSLNEWLQAAPHAQPLSTVVAALVKISDFASRAPRWILEEDVLDTGKYRFRLYATHHLPHSWDAGILFEETKRTLFCSDLFLQGGEVEPLVDTDVVGRARKAMVDFQSTQLLNATPYSSTTERQMAKLAALQPRTLAIMHGSSFAGDGGNAIRNLASAMKEVLGKEG